jgi:hypothetical protein
MSQFTVTLGNVELRPGHRHDCAQLELAVTVTADDKGAALDSVRELAAAGPIDLGRPFGRLSDARVTVTVNPDTIGARSVRVTEQP